MPSPSLDAFHNLHQQRYSFSDSKRPIEIVNVRLRMTAAAEPYAPTKGELVPGDGRAACYAQRDVFFDGRFLSSRFYRRDALVPGDRIPGPAMITEYTSATALPPGCVAQVDGYGNLLITIGEEAPR
jgi:N-methylhydantoinase A